MNKRIALIAIAVIAAAVPAAASAQAHGGNHAAQAKKTITAAELIGTYDLAFNAGSHQGGVPGELTIVRKGGELSGTITLHGQAMPISSIEHSPDKPTIVVTGAHGIQLTFTVASKDKLTGKFATEQMSGNVEATRRKA